MISALDISTSGLIAQRMRLDAISGNLANISTVVNANGQPDPYQPRYVEFQIDDSLETSAGAVGVKVTSMQKRNVEPNYKYDPDNPLAIQEGIHKGYVAYPRINMIEEFVNAMEATRSYEANIGVMEVTKDLGQQTLRIIG